MPDSLCPYFWKLVLMWILIIPYATLSLPYIFTFGRQDPLGSHFAEKPGSGLILWLVIYFIGGMLFSLSVFWYVFPADTYGRSVQVMGCFIWIIALCVLAYRGVIWAIEKYKRSKIKIDERGHRIWEPTPKKSNVLTEFIKAKYNKYCPKINWNE
jgi:hypothetical protein